jgi:Rv0078B-related antitoxin
MNATANRLMEALEMWEDGVQIMRENLRRRSSRATNQEIEAELARWLAGPDLVDSDHVIVSWPRHPR